MIEATKVSPQARKFNICASIIAKRGTSWGREKEFSIRDLLSSFVYSVFHLCSVWYWCTRMCRPLIYDKPSLPLSQCSSPSLLPCSPFLL